MNDGTYYVIEAIFHKGPVGYWQRDRSGFGNDIRLTPDGTFYTADQGEAAYEHSFVMGFVDEHGLDLDDISITVTAQQPES